MYYSPVPYISLGPESIISIISFRIYKQSSSICSILFNQPWFSPRILSFSSITINLVKIFLQHSMPQTALTGKRNSDFC